VPALICPKCSRKNDAKALRCSSCLEPLDASGARTIARDPRRLVGRVINGKYEVTEVLGVGGMGVVYKVRHLILQNKNVFALKVLHPRFSCQSNFQTRFLREVEIAMDLTHENVIQIRDFGVTEQSLLFYTMDFFPGKSLKALLEEKGALPPGRATAIARQVLLALAEAHKLGIVHRDLKPDNILIEASPEGEDRVRILDFGIAKLLIQDTEKDDGLTRDGVIGTPKYMSPEQASCEKVDGRADLYSLGVILHEMLAGLPPFNGDSAREVIMCHLTAAPRPLRQARPDLDVPAVLEDLVLRLLSKDPDERPGSSEEVLRVLAGEDTTMAPRVGPRRRIPRKRLIAGIALLILSAAALEHFVPWHRLLSSSAEAEGQESAGKEGGAAPREGPKGATPRRAGEEASPRRFRCAVCLAEYAPGEKVGDMCHGEPLLEAE
jgi:serine/threonine-protein kinase